MEKVIQEKESAISCAKYALEEYCDYFEKIYEEMLLYRSSGDAEIAAVCANILGEIPQMLAQVERTTPPLAWKLTDQPRLELPEECRQILAQIAG